MKKEQKEMLARDNEKHWKRYLEALDRAKDAIEAESFDWNVAAMALTDARRELRRCAETKVIKGRL